MEKDCRLFQVIVILMVKLELRWNREQKRELLMKYSLIMVIKRIRTLREMAKLREVAAWPVWI